MNLKKIEQQELQKRFARRRILNVVPGTEKRKMTNEEYKAWREANNRKRFGFSTTSRWNGGAQNVKTNRGNVTVPEIKKSDITMANKAPAKTPERRAFVPEAIRDLI